MKISSSSRWRPPQRGRPPAGESTTGARRLWPACAVLGVLLAFPGSALAHGPVAPLASSYLARVDRVPPGVQAEVIDGDQSMWLRVAPSETVVVLDYRGAPYLRFSRAGVQVNQSSAMYYLNQTPVAQTPPATLSPATAPSWVRVSGGNDYAWHDGRLHALATVALAPGATYIGRWVIPVIVDGHASSISGGVWHAAAPSIAWFWPIAVLILCALAAWRVRRPRLDALVARAYAIAALAGIAIAAIGRGLHGRPNVGVLQLVELGLLLVLDGWLLVRVLRIRSGYFRFFAIAFVALWEGAELTPTLLHGFVLLAIPAFLARAVTAVCLGCGLSLVVLAVRLADRDGAESPGIRDQLEALEDERLA